MILFALTYKLKLYKEFTADYPQCSQCYVEGEFEGVSFHLLVK